MLTFKCFQKMTKRDLVVASTRHHHSRLLKYYPRRQCAPSLINSRFFPHTTNLLTVLTFLHFEIPYMYTRGESQGASSGFGPDTGQLFLSLLLIYYYFHFSFLICGIQLPVPHLCVQCRFLDSPKQTLHSMLLETETITIFCCIRLLQTIEQRVVTFFSRIAGKKL